MLTLARPNVFAKPGRWFKGTVHTHTTNSDGKLSPGEVLAHYKRSGFEFVCIGDHWAVTTPQDPEGRVLVIPGCELDTSHPQEMGNTHVVLVGSDQAPSKPAPEAPRLGQQELLALAEAHSQFCFVAHPYWSLAGAGRLQKLESLRAIEVYNHGCEVEVAMGHAEFVWDMLLNTGMRLDALAVDDAHWRKSDPPERYPGGFLMVRADALTRAGIVAAIRAGDYYSTMGPLIESVQFADRDVTVRCDPARSVLFRCDGSSGRVVHAPPGQPLTSASFTVDPKKWHFLRIEVTDEQGRKAWTNPFYWSPCETDADR
jgi:hypothetical protein